mgnify:CR=1 FL=1
MKSFKINSQLFLKEGKEVDNHLHNDEYNCLEVVLLPRENTHIRVKGGNKLCWLAKDNELLQINNKLSELSKTFHKKLENSVLRNYEQPEPKKLEVES